MFKGCEMMRVLILAEENNRNKIEKYIYSYKHFFDYSEQIDIHIFNSLGENESKYDRVIVDEYNLNLAVKIYKNSSDYGNFYLWLFGAIMHADDDSMLETIEKRALLAKDWNVVKKINHIKVELNRIMKRAIMNSYPSQLQLESTSFCNAQCIMCSHYYAGNNGALDMNTKMLKKLVEMLPYLDLLIMHGNGEPFASKLFNECVDTYSSYGIGLTTNTNLSILHDEHIRRINQSFVNIRVSCDACTKEIYEGIRKNLSFDRFVNNARKLRDECPEVTKTMASVLMRQNIEQLPEMVRFAAKYGFEEIVFSNLGTSLFVGNEMDNISHYPYYAAKQLRHAIEVGKECGIKVTIPQSFDLELFDETQCEKEIEKIHGTPFFKTDIEIHAIKEFTESVVGAEYRLIENLSECYWDDNLYECEGICEWCIERPYIDLKGNVFVCCINASYRIGNIFDYDSFLDLWNNATYKKIRNLFYSGNLPGFCNNCQFILNGSLNKLQVPPVDENFYQRRRISKFYHDYCEEHQDE